MAENEILNQGIEMENTENQEVKVPEITEQNVVVEENTTVAKKTTSKKSAAKTVSEEEDETVKPAEKKATTKAKTASKNENVEEVDETSKPKRAKKEAVAKTADEAADVAEKKELGVEEPQSEENTETVAEIEISEMYKETMPIPEEMEEEGEDVEEVEDLVVEAEKEDGEEEVADNFHKDLQDVQHEINNSKEKEEDVEEDTDVFVEQIPDYKDYSPDALIAELDTLIQNEPFEQIKGRVSAIKIAFLEYEKNVKEAHKQSFIDGGGNIEEYVEPQVEEAERFFATFDLYKEKKAEFQEAIEKQKAENLKRKNEILDELRELLTSDKSLKITYDRFRELQNEWKNVGLVAKSEVAALWNNYHFLIEKFFQKVRISRELKDLDLKKNLDAKIALCEKAEELLLEENLLEVFRKLQEYHKQWKEIGQVPYANREEIWERFKAVTDKVNRSRREHYDSIREEQQANLEAKEAICNKVEDIVNQSYNSIKEWNTASAELDELFKLWKTIGSANKKQNNEIWTRFRGALNTFYTAKKEYFSQIKDQHQNNYNLKVNLCLEAEALQDSTNWGKTTQDLIRLQNEWKKIGPVPGKHSEKIWKRFRTACDTFFNNKEQFFSTRTETEQANLKAKRELIEEVKSFVFTEDKTEALNKLKEFQRRWVEIGFVPFKEKDKLQTAYREAINEQMEKLNITSIEFSAMEYKNRIETISELPDGDKTIRKEINFLQNKIAQMQDDINLLENNIGFLANSKNADILKKEFEKKIEKAKSELTLNITKLQYLRRQLSKEQEDKKK